MGPYNGFSGAQRSKAQRWLNRQWATGALARPSRCVACGQTEGVIDAHAEDYSEPFAAGKTDAFHLCYVCHLMVHCGARNPRRWIEYRSLVEEGRRTFPYVRRGWLRFVREILARELDRALFVPCDPPKRRALLEIEQSQDVHRFLESNNVTD